MGRTRFAMLAGTTLLAVSAVVHAQNAYTNRDASLRAGPDRSYPLVLRIDAGAPVDVMGCLDDWSWCDVSFDDARGWVYSPSLSYVYEGSRVPFYSYAPSFGLPVITFSLGTYWDQYYRGRPWFGQRDQWEHRNIPHRRPPGPPPRNSRPPLHAQGPGPRSPAEARPRGGTATPERGFRPESPERSGRGPEAAPRENEARPTAGREITPRHGAPERGAAPARGAPPARTEHPSAQGHGGEKGGSAEQGRGGEHPQSGHGGNEKGGNEKRNEGQGEPPR